MTRSQKLLVIILRMAAGWFLLYQGISAILNPSWSLFSYIGVNPSQIVTFPHFYQTVLGSGMLPYMNFVVKGALVLAGALLVAGIFVRIGALLGIALMLFFYFPHLIFPYVDGAFYIIDSRLLIAIVLAYLFVVRAGEFFGLGTMFRFSRY